jgi:serine/threonine protein kinase
VKTLQFLHPAALPSGTELGPWRVLSLGGRGTHGTVYRAEHTGHAPPGLVALKLAHRPMDPRFEREAEVLWRLRHPHVPRLLDRGWSRGPGEGLYPFLVMEWVEGVPLYAWASQPGRT